MRHFFFASLLVLSGCASLVGVDELSELPADFPLTLEGEIGHITKSPSGKLAVDVAFRKPEAAREAWKAMQAAAEADGFETVHKGHKDKRDRVILEGPKGKLELGCCRQRADRHHLAFVSWWSAADLEKASK